ncbi:hypothetical protein ACEWY4_024875 [Coilia grayii]|uniref:Nucleolar protein 10 n=1 Tax=Coilia grayii TaxID=363190 RepID=A0ABD1IZ18_9TELE
MFLQYYLNENGDRVYTLKVRDFVRLMLTQNVAQSCLVELLRQPYYSISYDLFVLIQKVDPTGQPTSSAHPARFSPDDKFSRHRVTIKKRFGLLLTQQPRPVL